MQRRTKIAVLGAVLLLITGATGSAMASATDSRPQHEAAALTGTAKLYRVAGDDITFSFDAHLAAKDHDNPLKATGTFRWSHYAANGEGRLGEGRGRLPGHRRKGGRRLRGHHGHGPGRGQGEPGGHQRP